MGFIGLDNYTYTQTTFVMLLTEVHLHRRLAMIVLVAPNIYIQNLNKSI